MNTYRIVRLDVHKTEYTNEAWRTVNKFRVDKHHTLLFGLIRFWDRGASDLSPVYMFPNKGSALKEIGQKNRRKHYRVYSLIREIK